MSKNTGGLFGTLKFLREMSADIKKLLYNKTNQMH